jgi:hypothetical protein
MKKNQIDLIRKTKKMRETRGLIFGFSPSMERKIHFSLKSFLTLSRLLFDFFLDSNLNEIETKATNGWLMIPSPENVETGKMFFSKYKKGGKRESERKKKESFCYCFASVASA